MSGYRKLKVYEKSYAGAKTIYKMTKVFPKEEIYGMTSQIRRASLSIPMNIAEGYAKKESQSEFKRYLMMAIGSANEMCVLIDFAKDIGYIDEEMHRKTLEEYEEISRMLRKFIQAVEKGI